MSEKEEKVFKNKPCHHGHIEMLQGDEETGVDLTETIR